MSLKASILALPTDSKMQLLGAAANEQFRQLLMAEILSLKERLANLRMPANSDGAIQFLAEYRQLRAECIHLEDLLGAFSQIVSALSQADTD